MLPFFAQQDINLRKSAPGIAAKQRTYLALVTNHVRLQIHSMLENWPADLFRAYIFPNKIRQITPWVWTTMTFEDLDSESWLSVIFTISPQKNLGNNLSSLVQNCKTFRNTLQYLYVTSARYIPIVCKCLWQPSARCFWSGPIPLTSLDPPMQLCCTLCVRNFPQQTHPVGLWAWQKHCGSFFVSLLPTEWGNNILLSWCIDWCIAEGSSVFQDWQHLRCTTQNNLMLGKKDGWQNSSDQ